MPQKVVYLSINTLIMKKILIFSLLVILIGVGCKKTNPEEIHDYKETRVDYTERLVMTFPSVIGFSIPWIFSSPTIGVTFNEKYKSNNPYLNLVEDVRPKRIKVILIDPVGENFSFIKNKRVYVSVPGQPEILLGSIQNLPDNVTDEMYLVPAPNVLLDKYMTEQMEMRIEVDADKSLLQDVQVAIELQVNARVKN